MESGLGYVSPHLGFKALASTSAGFAWTIGKPDNKVALEDVCNHIAAISSAVDVPVNADFEDGFAVEPKKVAANVSKAVKTGVSAYRTRTVPATRISRCSMHRSR